MPRQRSTDEKPNKKKVESDAPLSDVDRLRAMSRVADLAGSWKPAGEVLTSVKSVPTIFPLVDRAIGTGGWPIQRIALVHGPSSHGKTTLLHGIGLSFLKGGNFYNFIDAEYTTPIDWLKSLMAQYSTHPGFRALRPKSYEQTADAVREFATHFAKARQDGNIPDDMTGLIAVDSIRKLVPERALAKMLKDEGGIDGQSGRGAMMKAALNSQWMDELVPLLFHSNLSMAIITRENEAPQDMMKAAEPGEGFGYKVTGGKGLIFESSLVMRVTRSWNKEGSKEDARIIGERHIVSVTKTKVSGKTDKVTKGFFNTSNGVMIPEGFDRARDVIELAVDAQLIQASGAWLSCPLLGMKWNGTNAAVKALTADETALDTLEGEARAKDTEAPEDDQP